MLHVFCHSCQGEYTPTTQVVVSPKDKSKSMCLACYERHYVRAPKSVCDAADLIKMLPKPSAVKKYLDEYVIGQEETKRMVATSLVNHAYAIFSHVVLDIPLAKTNIAIVGESGSGKTYIVRKACEFLNIPFLPVNITEFTASGYVGRDVTEIVDELIDITVEKNMPKWMAGFGIVFIDEFDKIAVTNQGQVNTSDVQYGLLKLIEGSRVTYNTRGNQGTSLDTTHVMFIVGGAFTAIRQEKAKLNGYTLGFNGANEKLTTDKLKLRSDDLMKAGMLKELVGRIGVIIEIDKLTKEELREIVLHAKDSIKDHYSTLFKLRRIRKKIEEEDVDAIVNMANEMNLGARGLWSAAAKHFNEFLYN